MALIHRYGSGSGKGKDSDFVHLIISFCQKLQGVNLKILISFLINRNLINLVYLKAAAARPLAAGAGASMTTPMSSASPFYSTRRSGAASMR